MGGAVSSGVSNDDLIDNLLEADYIKTPLVERVFRAVDRGEYFIPDYRPNAYKDLAWKSGHLHISAPCIYSEVMEGLCLKPGLTFLNVGSGTGYLSTMVGLILGSSGVNHGIEIHEDVVQYAYKKLADFKRLSGAIDEYDFCEPHFFLGNGLCLSNNCPLYDRVYCGAACPQEYEEHLKNLLKIGGILVMPVNEQLLQIKRLTETAWEVKSLLPVSFASLIPPAPNVNSPVEIADNQIPSLQLLCRSLIRDILRSIVEAENPPVKRSTPPSGNKVPKKRRALKRFVVPLFDSDSSDDEAHQQGENRSPNVGASIRTSDGIVSLVLGAMRNHRHPSNNNQPEPMEVDSEQSNINSTSTTNSNVKTETKEKTKKTDVNNEKKFGKSEGNHENDDTTSKMDEEHQDDGTKAKNCDFGTSEKQKGSNSVRTLLSDDSSNNSTNTSSSSDNSAIDNNVVVTNIGVVPRNNSQDQDMKRHFIRVFAELGEELLGGSTTSEREIATKKYKRDLLETNRPKLTDSDSEDEPACTTSNKNNEKDNTETGNLKAETKNSKAEENATETKSSEKASRKKFDSGLGEEIIESLNTISSSDEESHNRSDCDFLDEIDSDIRTRVICYNCRSPSHSGGDTNEEQEENKQESKPDEHFMYHSPYTALMKSKIQQLPLPMLLKRFLNYDRDF